MIALPDAMVFMDMTKHFRISNLNPKLVSTVESPNYRNYIDWLVHQRRNSIASALELRLSCTDSSIWKLLHGGMQLQNHWRIIGLQMDGLAKDCSNSNVLAVGLRQSYAQPSK